MFYKIVAVDERKPEYPVVYRGECTPIGDDHPIISALADKFGSPIEHGGNAAERLHSWSDEAQVWDEELQEDLVIPNRYTVGRGGVVYYVFVSDSLADFETARWCGL